MGAITEQKYTLKELRARRNVTQAETAKVAGVSPQTYNAWERNPSNIPISKFAKLADYFGVLMSDIFLP